MQSKKLNVRVKTFLLTSVCMMTLAVASAQKANPFITAKNGEIEFGSATTTDIESAINSSIADCKAALQKVYAIPAAKRTYKNTIVAIDDITDAVYSAFFPINILYNASPDSALRNQAQRSVEAATKFENELNLDENLYKAYKEYAATAEAKNLSAEKKRFLKEKIEEFERNGFALPAEKRTELKQIDDKLSELSIAFSKNIATYKDQLLVDEEGIKGLPADYIKSRKKQGDKYIITLDGPSYSEFMKFAVSDDLRRQLFIKYNNRAADKNLDVLQQLLIQRQKKAKLLGFPTFAAYQTASRMAKNPATVWSFENNLVEKVKQKAQLDLAELITAKKEYLKEPSVTTVEPWETSFYNNLLMVNKCSVNPETVKEYLSLDNVTEGLFKVTQLLFGVKYVPVTDASVWHKDVKAFDVMDKGKKIGRFYLDLFPRENKYTHAACFPIRGGKQLSNGYQLPMAALICNFNAPTADKPSLLTHAQANLFFHEFGHVLHFLLTKAALGSQSGFSVKTDFIEAPSQIFENWMWDYSSVKLFAKHYKSREVLPQDLFQKMLAARNVGSGLAASQQLNLGIFDMTLHDKYDPNGSKTITDVAKEVYNSVLPFTYVDGTDYHAAFGHLIVYPAGYYGYMWSKVYAEDMFSVFEKTGILNPATGARYRNVVLARGGTVDELNMVKEFLGRDPNPNAFFKSLGLQVGF